MPPFLLKKERDAYSLMATGILSLKRELWRNIMKAFLKGGSISGDSGAVGRGWEGETGCITEGSRDCAGRMSLAAGCRRVGEGTGLPILSPVQALSPNLLEPMTPGSTKKI